MFSGSVPFLCGRRGTDWYRRCADAGTPAPPHQNTPIQTRGPESSPRLKANRRFGSDMSWGLTVPAVVYLALVATFLAGLGTRVCGVLRGQPHNTMSSHYGRQQRELVLTLSASFPGSRAAWSGTSPPPANRQTCTPTVESQGQSQRPKKNANQLQS